MIYTLKQGLQGLPEAMQKVVEEMGVKILPRQPCTALKFTANGVQVQLFYMDRSMTVDLLSHISLDKKDLDVMPITHCTGCVLANDDKRFTEHLLSMTVDY